LAGVYVDADGVMHKTIKMDPGGRLMAQRMAAAKSALPEEITAQSDLRKISLNRLEKALEAQLAQGLRPTDEMLYLAGLTRLEYVFVYPDSGDVVIAGPAEGWMEDLTGRVVGISSGRPMLELQDLIVALRAFPAGASDKALLGCSIDPTQEGLARMQQFLAQYGSRATPADTQSIVQGLRDSLGLQKVSVLGVSPKTHFAQVMVEADYRMKLIGIGLEAPEVNLASYVKLANPSQVSRNAMSRWYFTPDYECVRVSEDQMAMQLVGNGVKLISEDEFVTMNGGRRVSGKRNKASDMFTTAFTKKYPQIAEKTPIFAQLRNLIDMSVAAAFLQQYDYYGKAQWNVSAFADEETYAVERHTSPEQVGTAVNSIWKGNRLMTPVGGGVTVEPDRALMPENLLKDEDGSVKQAHSGVTIQLRDGQWWWE
jgi:hypothetical protein